MHKVNIECLKVNIEYLQWLLMLIEHVVFVWSFVSSSFFFWPVTVRGGPGPVSPTSLWSVCVLSTLCTLHCNFCTCYVIFTGGLNNGWHVALFFALQMYYTVCKEPWYCDSQLLHQNRSWILVNRVTYDPLYVKNIDHPISLLQGQYVSQCGRHVQFLTCIHIYSRHRISERFGDFKHVMVFIEAARVLW